MTVAVSVLDVDTIVTVPVLDVNKIAVVSGLDSEQGRSCNRVR